MESLKEGKKERTRKRKPQRRTEVKGEGGKTVED